MLMLNERMNEYVNKYSQKSGWFLTRVVLVRRDYVQVGFCPGGFHPGWFLSVYGWTVQLSASTLAPDTPLRGI